jgi:hypothetical protein
MPTLGGQPAFIQSIIHFGIMLWNTNTVYTDTAAGLLQVAIGALFFFPMRSKVFKAGAYISIAWGLIVWIFGEGFGMLLTGSASFYTGAPGAVLAYVALAFFLLNPDLTAAWYARFLGWVLVLSSALQLQPVFWTSDGIQALFMGSGDSLHAVAAFPTYLSQLAGAQPMIANVILILLPLVFGVLLVSKPNRTTAIATLVFLFFAWWLGQDFGALSSLFTGVPTDPNMAPVLALFLVPLLIEYRPNLSRQKT